jgi:D-threo-aldose 1-dehydrogenase
MTANLETSGPTHFTISNGTLPRLGLGCGGLIGGRELRRSTALLEAAYESGIRHFDVAPSYGLGTAEEVIGSVFGSLKDDISIATKVGISPPSGGALLRGARSIFRPIFANAQAMREKLGRYAGLFQRRAQFSPIDVQRSLEESLKRLRRDRIDALLMHEFEIANATDELLALLNDLVRSNVIGSFGVGANRLRCEAVVVEKPQFAAILQYPWSILEPRLSARKESLSIFSGVFRNSLRSLNSWFGLDANALHRYSVALGQDLSNSQTLAEVVLGAALSDNPSGIVLFATQNVDRIRRNAAVQRNSTVIAAGRMLLHLLRSGDDGMSRRPTGESAAASLK